MTSRFPRVLGFILTGLWCACVLTLSGVAAYAEPRIALVIGNAKYGTTTLPTALNDAGLIAQTLKTSGFEVIEGGELDQAMLRKSIRDYIAKVEAAGPETSAFVYFNGLALQFDGENILLPVDARLQRVGDLAVEGIRLSDIIRPLAGLPAKSRIIMIDAASPSPFDKVAADLARGLGVMDRQPGVFVGFAQAPGQVYLAYGKTPYGPFASALAEMMHEPGLSFDAVFERTRLRVHETTKGALTPWNSNGLEQAPIFVAATADTSQEVLALQQKRQAEAARPINELSAEEAYALAVEKDSISAYQKFVDIFPQHPLAKRVRALLAERREAYFWRRSATRNTPESYWTYVKTYPRGPHNADARRRLARLSAPPEPPPAFIETIYEDVPPPPHEEVVIVEEFYARPVYEPIYIDYPPPPPAPVFLLPPPPPYFINPPPPQPFFGGGPGFLPIPVLIPIFVPYSRRVQPPVAPPVVVLPPGGQPLPVVSPVVGQPRPPVFPPVPGAGGPTPPVLPPGQTVLRPGQIAPGGATPPGQAKLPGSLPVPPGAIAAPLQPGQVGSPLPKPPAGAIPRPGQASVPVPSSVAPGQISPPSGKIPLVGQQPKIAAPPASAAIQPSAKVPPVVAAPVNTPAQRRIQTQPQTRSVSPPPARTYARPQPQYRSTYRSPPPTQQRVIQRPQPQQTYRPPPQAYRPPPAAQRQAPVFRPPPPQAFRPPPAPVARPAPPPQRKICPPGKTVC